VFRTQFLRFLDRRQYAGAMPVEPDYFSERRTTRSLPVGRNRGIARSRWGDHTLCWHKTVPMFPPCRAYQERGLPSVRRSPGEKLSKALTRRHMVVQSSQHDRRVWRPERSICVCLERRIDADSLRTANEQPPKSGGQNRIEHAR